MKSLLLLALLAAATVEANATTLQDGQTPSGNMTKKERKAARQAKTPQVYKGTVAQQRRVVTDAAGSEDENGDDNTTTKSKKKSKQ